jgi:LmbE family N-acetylglucosaminyl deacetylase/CheY-like chemotaxis protein
LARELQCFLDMTNIVPQPRRRILLIEDDSVHARVISKWLLTAGYVVTIANSFTRALEELKNHYWSAVVSDCDLPDGNGLEIARLAKLAFPRLPFILITAGKQTERLIQAVRYGVDDMMLKMAPLKREQLITRLAELIDENQETLQTILAIGAHPDDVEIGCGGALLQHVRNGHRVVVLTCSQGSVGGHPEVRLAEAQESASLMGAELMMGDLPDTEIAESGATLALINRAIATYQPTMVYTHSINDVHQDHRNVARASFSAARSVPRVACYQAPSATVDFRPTMFVDIGPNLEKKLELLSRFQSQVAKAAYLAPDQIRANARYWSKYTSSIGAEPFEVVRACV